MDKIEIKFAMCISECKIINTTDQFKQNLETGDLTKIIGTNFKSDVNILIRDKTNKLWCKEKFVCDIKNLKIIPESIWHYLIAIKNAETRYKLYLMEQHHSGNDLKHLAWVSSLVLNDLICYGISQDKYECAIKYIGEVPEIGVGVYFGLKLLEEHNFKFLDVKEFIYNYPECDILVSAEFISRSQYFQPNLSYSMLYNKYFKYFIQNSKNKIKKTKNSNANQNIKLEEAVEEIKPNDEIKPTTVFNGNKQTTNQNQCFEVKPLTNFFIPQYSKTNIVAIDEDDIKNSQINPKKLMETNSFFSRYLTEENGNKQTINKNQSSEVKPRTIFRCNNIIGVEPDRRLSYEIIKPTMPANKNNVGTTSETSVIQRVNSISELQNKWNCTECTFTNDNIRQTCEMCDNPKVNSKITNKLFTNFFFEK